MICYDTFCYHKNKHMTKKQSSRQRRLHVRHFHFHVGVYMSIAALLVTALKTSHEMVQALYGAPMHTDITNTHMREAETHNAHISLNCARRPTVSGG